MADVSNKADYLVGVDLGGTKILSDVFKNSLECVATAKFSTKPQRGVDYLRANSFQTFIVSGGGIEFMRPWTKKVYGIPPEQVIGSSGKLKYEMRDSRMRGLQVRAFNEFEEAFNWLSEETIRRAVREENAIPIRIAKVSSEVKKLPVTVGSPGGIAARPVRRTSNK